MSSQEMVVCVANGCSNKPCKDLSFFSFPENKEQRARWISAIQKPEGWQPSANSKICSVHFVTRAVSPHPWHPDYVPSVFRSLRTKKRDKSSRARQIIEAELGLDDKGGDGSDDSRKQKKSGALWRASEEVSLQNEDSFDAPRPTVGRKKKITDAALLSESKRKLKQMEMSDVDFYEEDQMSVQSGLFDSHDDDSIIEAVTEVKPKRGRGRGRGRGRRGVGGRGAAAATRDQGLTEDGKCRNCQNYIQQIAVLQEELNAKKVIVSEWDDMVREKSQLFKSQLDLYKGELQNVKDKLSALELNEEFFKKNKHRIVMYTGFPNYSVLITLFNLVHAAVKRDRHIYSITAFQKFILCLMRLRMNLKFKDLANRFAIDLCKIERFFPEWIDALHKQVSHVLVWPSDNVQYRLSVLSQSLKNHYRIVKDVVPVTKFISSDGHVRQNHKIEIVCAALQHISEVAVSEVQDKLPDVLISKEETLVNYLKAVGKYMPPPPPPPPPVVNIEKTEQESDVKENKGETASEESSFSINKEAEEMECETVESNAKVEEAKDSLETMELSSEEAAPDEQSSDPPMSETSTEEPEGAGTSAPDGKLEESNASMEDAHPVDSDAASEKMSGQDDPADAKSDATTADSTPDVIESADARATDALSAEITSVDAAATEISHVSSAGEESSSPTTDSAAIAVDGTSSEAASETNKSPDAESAQPGNGIADEAEVQPSSEASVFTEVVQKEDSEKIAIPSTAENIFAPLPENASMPSVSESIPFSSASESVSIPPVSEGEFFSSAAESATIPSVSENSAFPIASANVFLPEGSSDGMTSVAVVTRTPPISEGALNDSTSVSNATSGGTAEGSLSAALEQMDVDVPVSIMPVSDASVVTSSVASSILPHDDLVFTGTDVPSVAADLLSELMDAASSTEGGNAVTEELLSVANAMVANVTSNINTSTANDLLGTPEASKMDTSSVMSEDNSASLSLETMVGSATSQSSADCTNLEKLHLECQALHEEILDHIEILRDQLPYNTKLPSFEAFEEISSCVKAKTLLVPSSEVPQKLQCWLTLSKLKLNLDDLDLSYSYNISLDNIKRIFSVFIPALAKEWKDEEKYDSIADEILIKEFSYLSRSVDDESAWKACRYVNSKSKSSTEAPASKNILYSNSFSEVWGSVGPGRSASELQQLLAAELQELQRIMQQRPVLSEELLSSCHESFVEYYTSFCDYDSLHDVYTALLPGPKVHSSKSADLSLFGQFLCVLLRLVNNLSKDEILLRLPKVPDNDDSVEQLFNKRDPDVDAIISTWLPWIHSRFMQLVTWPEVQDDGEEFLRDLRQRYRYLQKVDPQLRMQAEAVSTALFNAGHHLYCVTSEEEEELSGDELVDWLF